MTNLKSLVNTQSGPVQGVLRTAIFGQDYWSYEGIPYAEPPIGELRFKSPVPIRPWTKVLDASRQGPSCWNMDPGTRATGGDEDCLHLNIYVEQLASAQSKPLPVIVFVHGGAFMFGSSGKQLYGADYFMTQQVVLVTINYRVGAFGFLAIDDPTLQVPGNAGLKDQRLALQWIHQNVQCFNGDPSNITLCGESAGACSAHYHLLSANSRHLFHRAILMSGCALNPWSTVDRKLDTSQRLAVRLGWNDRQSNEDLLSFLQKVSPIAIVREQNCLLTEEEKGRHIMYAFGPVIEPAGTADCVVASSPLSMSQDETAWSHVAQVPVLILATSEEGLYMRNELNGRRSIEDVISYVANLLPTDLGRPDEPLARTAFAERLNDLYFQSNVISMDNAAPFIDFISDKWFLHGLHRTIRGRIEGERGATYVLRFNVDLGACNHFKTMMCGDGVSGSCHADNCSYMFKNKFVTNIEDGSKQRRVIDQMIHIIYSFADHGVPQVSKEAKDALTWPKAQQEGTAPYQCVNLSADGAMVTDFPELSRMQLWDSLYDGNHLF